MSWAVHPHLLFQISWSIKWDNRKWILRQTCQACESLDSVRFLYTLGKLGLLKHACWQMGWHIFKLKFEHNSHQFISRIVTTSLSGQNMYCTVSLRHVDTYSVYQLQGVVYATYVVWGMLEVELNVISQVHASMCESYSLRGLLNLGANSTHMFMSPLFAAPNLTTALTSV